MNSSGIYKTLSIGALNSVLPIFRRISSQKLFNVSMYFFKLRRIYLFIFIETLWRIFFIRYFSSSFLREVCMCVCGGGYIQKLKCQLNKMSLHKYQPVLTDENLNSLYIIQEKILTLLTLKFFILTNSLRKELLNRKF